MSGIVEEREVPFRLALECIGGSRHGRTLMLQRGKTETRALSLPKDGEPQHIERYEKVLVPAAGRAFLVYRP